MSNTLRVHGLKLTRLLCPWDSLGKDTRVGCHALLQRIFPTQGSNPHLLQLLHCRRIPYHWATRENPLKKGMSTHPLQHSFLENCMDRGGWWTAVHGVAKSQAWPSNWHFHLLPLLWYWLLCNNEMSTSCQELGWSCAYQVAPQLWIWVLAVRRTTEKLHSVLSHDGIEKENLIFSDNTF